MKKFIIFLPMFLLTACNSGTLGSVMLGSSSGILGTGVKETLVEPGVWQIDARSADGFQSAKRAQGLALERAVSLFENSGKSHLYVMDFRGTENSIRGRGTIGADVMILVKGTTGIETENDCRASSQNKCYAMTIEDARKSAAALKQYSLN